MLASSLTSTVRLAAFFIQTALCGSGPFQTASSLFADKLRSISAPALCWFGGVVEATPPKQTTTMYFN